MLHLTLAALAAVVAGAVAQPVSDETSTVFDPVGDVFYNAPAFQDIVFSQITKTEDGDLELLMEMEGCVPANPPMPPPAHHEIWWAWFFDFDPGARPRGYPLPPGYAPPPHSMGSSEFIVYVSWDGTEFAGVAIDRRPLLTGGEAIITPVAFSIDGAIVEALLLFELFGEVPSSFGWHASTRDWSAPPGSMGWSPVDDSFTVFNP